MYKRQGMTSVVPKVSIEKKVGFSPGTMKALTIQLESAGLFISIQQLLRKLTIPRGTNRQGTTPIAQNNFCNRGTTLVVPPKQHVAIRLEPI